MAESDILYELKKAFLINNVVKNVNLEIEYSSGENGELEFESVRVNDNTLTLEEKLNVEKQLENGVEEDIVKVLYNYYAYKGIIFLPNHYQI